MPRGATTQRAIPLGRGGLGPPGDGKVPPCRGGVPPGGACPAGARSISFSAEKETGLDSKEKLGWSTGRWYWKNGGLRLYALFGDQPRPLRPSHSGTGKRLWFYLAAAWMCRSRGRVRRGRTGGVVPLFLRLTFFLSAAKEAPDHPGPERGPRRRRLVRAQASPCSAGAGRNGREGSFLSYESCMPPFSTPNLS